MSATATVTREPQHLRALRANRVRLPRADLNAGAPRDGADVGPQGPATGPAGDDLDGTYPNPTVSADAIGADEVADFDPTNADVGVLFAEVNANGELAGSSGGVTVVKLGSTGNYAVDFGRPVSTCTAVATIGPAGFGSASGEIDVADRAGEPGVVFVDTNDSTGAAGDRPFRLVVVCRAGRGRALPCSTSAAPSEAGEGGSRTARQPDASAAPPSGASHTSGP